MWTMWAGGVSDPIDGNLFGNHPVALVHRLNGTKASTHAMLMLSTNEMYVVLTHGVLKYRINGGTLGVYLYSGVASGKGTSSPTTAIAQYISSIGTPMLPP